MEKRKQKKKNNEYKYRAASSKVRAKDKGESQTKVSEAISAEISSSNLNAANAPFVYKNARTARVTITVDSSLLAAIDDYVEQHHDTNRSAEFERALNMWAHWLQEECDKACYQNMSAAQKKEQDAWTAVTTEAAKYIWQ